MIRAATISIFIIEICLTIEFFQTIDVNLLIKYSLVLDILLSIIEIYLSNVHHHEFNTKKSISRKIAIILTAKFNRIMLKEIFAEFCPKNCSFPQKIKCSKQPKKQNKLNFYLSLSGVPNMRGGWVGSDVWDKVPNKTVFLGPSLTVVNCILLLLASSLWAFSSVFVQR